MSKDKHTPLLQIKGNALRINSKHKTHPIDLLFPRDEMPILKEIGDYINSHATLVKQRDDLKEVLGELVDIIDSGSVMDTFTTQPAKAALAQCKDKE